MPTATWWNLDDARRDRVIRAAVAEFGRRGFSAGSLNVVAREAGVAKGSLFQYFDDKLDLYATMCDIASRRARQVVFSTVVVDGTQPYFQVLRAVVRSWVKYFRDNPSARAMALASRSEPDHEARTAVLSITNAHFVEALGPLIERAIARGEFLDGVDPDHVLSFTVLLLRHLVAAPFDPEADPVLGPPHMTEAAVDAAAVALVDALERAYAARRRSRARA